MNIIKLFSDKYSEKRWGYGSTAEYKSRVSQRGAEKSQVWSNTKTSAPSRDPPAPTFYLLFILQRDLKDLILCVPVTEHTKCPTGPHTLSQYLCPMRPTGSHTLYSGISRSVSVFVATKRETLGRHPAVSRRETFLRKLRTSLSNSSLENFRHQCHHRTWVRTKGTNCPAGFSCLMKKKGDKRKGKISLKIDLGVQTLPVPPIMALRSPEKCRLSNALERLRSPDQFLWTYQPPSDFSTEHIRL